MQIKIEDNKVLVAQKNQEDLTGYQEASPLEAQIIYQANETDTLSMINGAYYEPKNNADWQNELMVREKEFKKASFQNQIDSLERIAGVRAFREYMLYTVKDAGVKTAEYPNGKTLDIDNQIKELRVQIASLG